MGEADHAKYAVLVTKHEGGFTVRIRELLLVEHASTLQQAYEQLMNRKRKVIDWARSLDALHELPSAEIPGWESRRSIVRFPDAN